MAAQTGSDRPSAVAQAIQPSSTSSTTVTPNSDGHGSGAIAQYLEWLETEITVTAEVHNNPRVPLETVFFGGGTPSLLSVSQLGRILDLLHHHIGIHPAAEISIEMDPATFSLPQIQGYAQLGINRVSLGVQAFQRQLLAACGRTHTPQDILQSLDWIHRANINNFSLDLISGLPHQSMEMWLESLEQAIALQPPHISVYDLTIEPMTAFGRWYQPGVQPLPTDEETAQMYRLAQAHLSQAGYCHYEISNYAKPGFQCRHNQVYWRNQPHYGFGLGATSYLNGVRYSRPRTQADYRQWVTALVDRHGIIDASPLSSNEVLLDTLMVGLRLAEGIDLAELAQQFGDRTVHQLLDCLQPYRHKQWVEVDSPSTPTFPKPQQDWPQPTTLHPGLRLRFTDPEGFLFSNVVLSEIFSIFQS